MCSVCNTAHNIISAVWFPCKSLPHSSDYRTLSSNSDKELTTTTKYIYNNVKCKLINENYLISSVRCVCFCVCDVVVTAIAAVAAAAYGWIVISLPFSVVRARRDTGEWSPLTFNFACDPSFVDMYLFCLLLACRPFPHSSQISFSWLCYLLLCGCSSHTAHPMTNLLTSTLDIAVYFGRILSFFFCFVNLLWENDRRKKHARLLNGGNDSRKNAYTWQSSIARMRFSLISHDFKFTRQIYRGSASARANAWWQTICSPVRRLLAHFQVEFSVTNKPSAQAAYNFHERNMYT